MSAAVMTRTPRLATLLLPVLLAITPLSSFAQGTRIDSSDALISYSGNWYGNSSANHVGGQAALTNTAGARATITFTGTGLTWIGVSDGWAGLANVFLDGKMQVIDTYANSMKYQNTLYTVSGLAPGSHTFTIEVTHERGGHTQGSWVWIDAFIIENGSGVPGGVTASAGRVEENNPALSFTGRWYSNGNPAHSGGSASLAMDPGSKVTLTFNGTGIGWVAYRDEWSGIARVYVDGELKTTIDNYLAPSQTGMVPYSISGLPSGSHTLTIEATGTRNQSSKGAWVWVDAFDVIQ